MTSHLPEHAQAFRDQFIRVESVLRKAGFVDPKRKRSMVAWDLFAEKLGSKFFDRIRDAGKAGTLIRQPPRAYFREAGWQETGPQPLATVKELFERGVCQVRHNIEHGLKYIDPEAERSDIDGVPPRGVTDGIGRRAVRLGRVGQRAATAGRLMKGSSLNCPTLSSVM